MRHAPPRMVTVDGHVLVIKEKAYLVEVPDEVAGIWLPLSQVTPDPEEGTLLMPEWLALEKGLI